MKNREWVVGIDEVGRGPLAGPVTLCACAIEYKHYKKIKDQSLTDSKKMSPHARMLWYKKALLLKKEGFLKFSLSYRSNRSIDQRGIARVIQSALFQTLRALALNPKKTLVLLDGSLKAPEEYLFQRTIIKGDQKEKIISLASVIAKVSRDKKMVALHKKYPDYDFVSNKGYGTRNHFKALKKKGLSPIHRKSFLSKL